MASNIDSRINTIVKAFVNGKDRKYILSIYKKKWGTSRSSLDRYMQMAKPIADKLIKEAKKEAEAVHIEEEKKAAKDGLKSKNDRLLILQTQVSECIFELEQDVTEYINSFGKSFERCLTIMEKTKLRSTIRDLQAEISKIQGDYAIVKTDLTINGEVPVEKWINANTDK